MRQEQGSKFAGSLSIVNKRFFAQVFGIEALRRGFVLIKYSLTSVSALLEDFQDKKSQDKTDETTCS